MSKSTYLNLLSDPCDGQWPAGADEVPGLKSIAAAVDRLTEQQRARNLLALYELERRGLSDALMDEARRIITGGTTP